MTPTKEEASRSFRFSTDDLPQSERAEAVCGLHERASLPGKIEPLEPLPDCPIRVVITKQTLPGVGLMSGTLGGIRQAARSRADVSRSEDDLLLAINLSGCSIAQQRDRELKLDPGDAILATRGLEGFSIIRPTPVRFMGLRVPRDAIASLVGQLDDAPIQLVPHGTEALTLLAAYGRAILAAEAPRKAALRRLVASHVQDLVAAIVAAAQGNRAAAQGRAIASIRLRAIMADIAAHLGDYDRTAVAVAQRQRVTPRYVHKLFEREGLVFSQYVISRRLECAHRLLTQSHFAQRSISSVAFEVGFGDLSYFNRVFRRRYSATPSEVRRCAGRGDWPRETAAELESAEPPLPDTPVPEWRGHPSFNDAQ